MQDVDAPIADLFVDVDRGEHGLVPKRISGVKKGLALRYFIALLRGFTARRGGVFRAYDETNTHAGEMCMEGEVLTFRVLGKPVLGITRKKAKVPVLEVGEPGASWLEMWCGDELRYVSLTPSGRLTVRKTPPGKA